MTIKQFKEIYSVMMNSELSEPEKAIKIIAKYYYIDEAEVEQMKVNEANEKMKKIYKDIEGVLNAKPSLPYHIETADNRYRVCQMFDEMCFAQFIDWQVTIAEGKDVPLIVDKLICCFIKRYNSKTKEWEYVSFDALKDIENIDVTYAFRIAAFFLRLQKMLQKHIQKYSDKKTMEMAKMKVDLMKQITDMTKI